MRWALLTALGVLCACSVAGAQSQSRTYLPLGPRDALFTPTRTPTAPPTAIPPPTATPTRTPTATPTPLPAPANLQITTHSGRTSSTYHYVYFRFDNTGGTTAYDPRANVTYYNDGGAIVGSVSAFSNLSEIRADGFSTGYTITQPGAGWTRYEISASSGSRSLTYLQQDIVISELNSYRTGSSVYVVGRVTSNYTFTTRRVELDVGIYAPGGTIVDSTTDYPFGVNDVPPGASTTFSVQFFDFDNRIPAGYAYTVRGESYVPP